MGVRGPVNKRASQRHGHRSKEELADVDRAPAAEEVEVPEPDELWHPIARDWFVALGKSGQSTYYEPSDWAEARLIAEVMSRALEADKINGPLLAALQAGSTRLLATEGDRRRMRVALVRGKVVDADEEAAVADRERYLRAVSG